MPGSRRVRPRMAVDPPRRAAYDALLAVLVDDAYLNLTLPGLLAAAGLAGRDAAFATELANGTARMLGSYDLIIDHHLEMGVASLGPEVVTALRLGTHQLLSMRVPAHAAVGTSVELVRADAGERPVRLVNAVLRKIGTASYESWITTVAPREDGDAVGHLAVRFAHPGWIVASFQEALAAAGRPEEEVSALLAQNNVAATVTLAVRPGLAEVADLVTDSAVRPGRWSPYAAYLSWGDPGSLGEVRAGKVGVQDEGSQLAALMLVRAPVVGPERRWLDLCAGPGGKAALLTGLARERHVTLLANEPLPHRARLVRQALRAYDEPPPVIVADGTRPAWGPQSFDRVLVDAPCSGLGALRRRPDSRWRRQPHDLDTLVPLQRALLDSAVESTRPGGAIAYATCSPDLQETRGVVDHVLAGRDDVAEEDARLLLPWVQLMGPGPHVQLWPHLHGTDAMFVAILRRRQAYTSSRKCLFHDIP